MTFNMSFISFVIKINFWTSDIELRAKARSLQTLPNSAQGLGGAARSSVGTGEKPDGEKKL